jgi:hypothetical protein
MTDIPHHRRSPLEHGRDEPERTCPLGEDCDLTVAWMAGRKDAEEALARRAVELALEEAADVAEFLGDPAPAIRALDPDAILARAKGG